MPEFCHLHCHTQYSLLDGASDISKMMQKANADGQKGVALTDHGNMFGAFKFVAEARKQKLKAIVGCEFYLVEDRFKNKFLKSKGQKDKRYHQLLLAKDQIGYQNLSKLCSLGFIEGLYGKFPRIDKSLIEKYHMGLIATSCCIGAEIPQAILHGKLEKAEELVKWWKNLFGEDFYIELQRHKGLENIDNTGVSQEDVNQQLIKYATKYDIKLIATNDSHYIERDDWISHDILLCVNTGSKIKEEKRFKFPSTDFFFKSTSEMMDLFHDIPEAIDNTMEVFSKVSSPQLERDIMLPNFPLPTSFRTQKDYLRHLVYEGASYRYREISEIIRERIDHELAVIDNMGFNGYFLVVQDFIKAARNINVSVGPGRGSAAGSVVAYCLTITNLDPIHYNLIFERFLNPERVSMPDIDIDFDDEGRQKVIDWVVDKYGKQQVAQIVTFGTMAAKSSIRDVARVMDYPLNETDKVAKLVPMRPGVKLSKIMTGSKSDLSKDWQGDDLSNIQMLQNLGSKTGIQGEVLQQALKVEGSIRNTGIHAAGIIISSEDITKHIPVWASKDSELLITQFDGGIVESAGMLKMDFLGLKTLSIIKDTLENINLSKGDEYELDLDSIPLDDEKTFKLFQNGDMVGVFQFESEGMQKYLRDLKPNSIEDLIAMNALYRPGPMENIPSFIRRKHGLEKVEYPHEWLREILKPTYGIMVYQEQIMQAAQIMADFSLGKADILRRAMGKKKRSEMEKQRLIFIEGAVAKGVDEQKADNIFKLMAKFAQYGFNRSHAAAYSLLAFQTAYLKAHFPAEFMSSVLTHNKSDISKLNFFLRECKRMGLSVLGPDINESGLNFSVNQKGQIRFGLSAIKGIGENPVEEIIAHRKTTVFENIFQLTKTVNLRSVNKKSLEALALSGALDSFSKPRSSYFQKNEKEESLVEQALKYGNLYQKEKLKAKTSLFGDILDQFITEPKISNENTWSTLEKLTKEKEVTGIYISGHPLDDYQMEIDNFTNSVLEKAETSINKTLKMAGIVVESFHGTNAKGLGYGRFTIQDYTGTLKLAMYREDYQKYKSLIELGQVLYVEGVFQSFNDSDRLYFRIAEIKLLESIGKLKTKFLKITLNITQINQALIEKLSALLSSHKGRFPLRMIINDTEVKDLSLHFQSKNHKVDVNHKLIDSLKELGISCRIK